MHRDLRNKFSNRTTMRYELKMAILKSGIPQWRIAGRAEIPEAILSHIVRGARDPGPSTAKRLSEILNVPVSELFPAEEEKERHDGRSGS